MEKHRRKKRSNQDIASNRLKPNGITQHIIAKAIVEAEEIRAQRENKNKAISIMILKGIIVVIFGLAAFFLFLFSIYLFLSICNQNTIFKSLSCVGAAATVLAVAITFVVAAIEVFKLDEQNINDRNYILSLFASVASIVSVLVSIIAIVRSS